MNERAKISGRHRRPRHHTRTGAVAAAGVLAVVSVAGATAAQAATPNDSNLVDRGGHWAPAATAAVHPGVVTQTGDAQCTANFLYTDALHNVYLGQAAHCSGTGQDTDTNGCTSKSLPLGTDVKIVGTNIVGKMVYNSWLLMQQRGEKDEDACAFNDLALIKLPASAIAQANPSIPVFGGPTGLNTTGTTAGDGIVSYGNSPLRQGISELSPKYGTSLGDDGGGWTHTVYTLTPGVPGDSGSAVLDSQGRALGDLSTLALLPTPLSNQVSDLAHELAYAHAHSDIKDLRVVAGTEAFHS